VPGALQNDDLPLYIWSGDYNGDRPYGRDRFKFQPVDSEGNSISDDSGGLWHGYYHILAGHSAKTIQARGGNREAGTPIVQDGTGGPGNTKQWRLVSSDPKNDNYYHIVNKNGNGVMEVVENGKLYCWAGEYVKLGQLNKDAAFQQWQVLGVSS
jgi:hypothetical protein